MLSETCPISKGSPAEGTPAREARRGEPEGAPEPTAQLENSCPVREGLPDRACANLCLLYQGARACLQSPFSRTSGDRGGKGVA
jgi:hypothetical protein